MMLTVGICRPRYVEILHDGVSSYYKFPMIYASSTMTMDSKSCQTHKKQEFSVKPPEPSFPQIKKLGPSNLRFDRLQPSDQDCIEESGIQFGIEFGQFLAREAVLDEEYWTAAWLRAETHWDNLANQRYAHNYKRQFAEQEFNSLKRRCKAQHGQKCNCVITVRKAEKNVKRTVLKSVVGTLDLSIRYLLSGESFPGERVKAPLFCSVNRAEESRFLYIANLCVSKSARRQGIASNMLYFALEFAKSSGIEEVFVHVDRSNSPAQELYRKIGFKMVEVATPQLSKEQMYLLSFKV